MTDLKNDNTVKQQILQATKDSVKTDLKIEVLTKAINASFKHKISVDQVMFLIFTYLTDSESIYKMCQNGFTNKEVNSLWDTWILNKVTGKDYPNPNRTYPDLINLSDESIELVESLIGTDSKQFVGLFDEFMDVYPTKSNAGYSIRNTPNRRETEKEYLNAIKAEAIRRQVSIVDYHKQIIEGMKDNKDSIVMGISKFIENRVWNDFIGKKQVKYKDNDDV